MRALPWIWIATGCTTQLGSDEQAIIGGTVSTGNTAVVMLAGYPPDRTVVHTCTAVVVSPTVALTSAHCIDAPTHPNYLYGVFPGDDAAAYPFLVDLEPHLTPVTSVHPHPQYSPTLPFYGDIGVIVLGTALPVAPLPMQRTPIGPYIVGMPAKIVGYGQTTYQTFNQTRHEAMTTVTAIEDDTIVVGDSAKRGCLGDSGGPAIVGGVVVGIDSYGPTGCGGPAHYRRVDSFLPFIDQYVPPPAAPDAGVGGTPDAGTDDPGDDGGCATTRGGGFGALVLIALAVVARRRRPR